MRIIVDSREQAPFQFGRFDDVTTERGSITTGDYSLAGLTHLVGIERKSLDDLIGSITHDRDRFMREVQRGRGLRLFAVVCEGSWLDLQAGRYRSRMNPQSAMQTVISLCAAGTQVIMAGSRERAEIVVHGLLRHFLRHRKQEAEAIAKALG